MDERRSDDGKVICPSCNTEFRAVPVTVQEEIETLRQLVNELESEAKMPGKCSRAMLPLLEELKSERAISDKLEEALAYYTDAVWGDAEEDDGSTARVAITQLAAMRKGDAE